jgi:hypothetical protein
MTMTMKITRVSANRASRKIRLVTPKAVTRDKKASWLFCCAAHYPLSAFRDLTAMHFNRLRIAFYSQKLCIFQIR